MNTFWPKIDNLEKTSFLKNKNYQIDNLNSSISSLKFEFVVKYLSWKKSLGPDVFSVEFYQIFKKQYQFYINCLKKLKNSIKHLSKE